MIENFDYTKAIEELEKLAVKVEDPATGIEEIDACIQRADFLVAACREYLRTIGEKIEKL